MISLTETAAREVKTIIERQREDGDSRAEQPKERYLRVGVKGGGCSGFSYTLDLTDTIGENDESWEQHGIRVICDPKSFLYLDGTKVDFKDEIMGRGFFFENPNATGRCGCGASFSA
jgi:iron-sulfur cluster assembly protein